MIEFNVKFMSVRIEVTGPVREFFFGTLGHLRLVFYKQIIGGEYNGVKKIIPFILFLGP